jgi:hypothetical protein
MAFNLKIVHDCLILLHPTSSFTVIIAHVIEFYIVLAVNIGFSNNQISKCSLLVAMILIAVEWKHILIRCKMKCTSISVVFS